MAKGDLEGVKDLAGGFEAGFVFDGFVLAVAVGFVADDGMSDVFEVDSDLVGASGVEEDFYVGRFCEALEDTVAG